MSSPPLWQELSRIAGWPLRTPARHRPAGALAREAFPAWSDTLPEARFLDEPAAGAPIERLPQVSAATRSILTF